MLKIGTAVAGGVAGAMVAGCASPGGGYATPAGSSGTDANARLTAASLGLSKTSFPPSLAAQIEEIIQAEGTVSNGVLDIEIDRNDLTGITLRGIPIQPSFEVNGTLYFQSQGGNTVYSNSDLCLKRDEVDPFIDKLIEHGIIFQAEHQHFYDLEPIVFFIHFRMLGDAVTVARAFKDALDVTSTPFPQKKPKNPTTQLPADEMGKIIGATPSIGAAGVVNFNVPRKGQVMLGGLPINEYLNIATSISFEPLDRAGKLAAAVPDFGMISSEITSCGKCVRIVGTSAAYTIKKPTKCPNSSSRINSKRAIRSNSHAKFVRG